jgi:tetratricopeptide (TPR) repeat protein
MTEPVVPATPSHSPPVARTDAFLAALVLAFAFLSASFAARNSDFWLHLASGRLLAHGQYTFGADPFAYTTDGVYWANHSWLFDLGLYAGWQTLGGAGLVVLKAAAVAVLAALLLRLSRPAANSGPFWVGGFCTLLALLASSPRLLLQPACLSLLLLAVCLALLRAGGRALYALPVVIAVWVNLDAWFLLGPLLVALFWLGGALDREAGRLPLWLLPACLAACLLNPHHVHALTLPAELSPSVWGSDLRRDVRFAPLFASPWHLTLLGRAGGFSLAAWAYFLLLGLGVVSFAGNGPARRSWRLPVWLAFGLLGAWQVRLVPFFAVVAGPITALNLRDRLAPDTLAGLGRAGLLLTALALLALTWPGWLQGFQRRDRALAWAVPADPSLQRLADTLARWRREGALPDAARTFALHPDVAHYCAWFCPGEKTFLDSRLPLFVPVAAEFERLCLALNPTLHGPAPASAPSGWRDTLRDHRIACLVLYDPDLRRLAPALGRVALPRRPGEDGWELLRVAGQAVVVGWTGAAVGPSPALRFDAERAVFARAKDVLPPAPAEGPAELPRELSWWQRYLHHSGSSAWETAAASVYLRLFEEGAASQLRRQRVPVLARYAGGLVGVQALSAGTVPAALARVVLPGVFLPDLAERPAALPLLAVRAARRAVAEQPEDAGAWLVLAQAYLSLGRTTIEARRDAALPPLAEVRYVQTVTALVQAVTVRPNLAAAHEALASLYTERRYLDLALRHRRTQLRLTRQAGRLPGEKPVVFADRLGRLERMVEGLQRVVEDSENRFVVRTHSLAADPLARAQVALQLGLAGKALDGVLLRSSPDLYGVVGLRLLLELLLHTGRAQDARDLLDRAELRRHPLGLGPYDLVGGQQGGRRWGYRFLAYDWFDLCQAAAVGNYEAASAALQRLRDRLQREGPTILARLRPALARWLASKWGLWAVPPALGPRLTALLLERAGDQVTAMLSESLFLPAARADLHVVEGMLLLERGLPEQAGTEFRRARALYRRSRASALVLPGRPLTQRYLERLRQATR